jgi:hypothetical protein
MKRFALLLAILILVFAFPALAQERSPDRSHVSIAPVPAECLASGTAERGHFKYTCNKVDSSDVWNEQEAEVFQKDIFEASMQPLPKELPPASRIGLVVRQDSTTTQEHVVTQPVTRNEVAFVERRQNFKYRYVKK